MPFPRASAICVCAKSHARCPSTSLVLLFPSLPSAPYTTFPRALTLHVCSAQYLQPPPYVPCVSARHLLCPSLAFPTSFCHLCLRKISCALPSTSLVLLFPSLPCAPYTTFPHALTLSPLLNVGRGPAPWPDKQLCVAVSSSCRCFKHSCLRHTWRPPQLLSGPLSSPHAYATRSCPTLGWPLSAYKPACAFLYTTDSPVACGVRVCKLLPCSNLSLPFPFATCLRHSTPGQPLSSYKPCTPHVLLCSPHGACQSCLSDAWCVFLLPSRAYAICVCPTLGCSLSLDSPPCPDTRHKV